MQRTTPLAEGNWAASRTPTTALQDGAGQCFFVVALDKAAEDRVVGTIHFGGPAVFGGYLREEWSGLPAGVENDAIWHLARIEPREQKVAGGTKALLSELARLADESCAWILTEAMPTACSEETMMRVLRKHGGFTSPDEDFPAMMLRRPAAPGTANDDDPLGTTAETPVAGTKEGPQT